ncbi:MAG: sulfopyruvate decarboxylase subunit alpha [Nitrospiraceae bacterium]|nr:MAG: sulfopyruvate decarboxylase subunit alpha [Nitrospiraceae bacterium]
MLNPEERIIEVLRHNRVDFLSSLPCDRIKSLLERMKKAFFPVPLTREEEGVGISAGIALAGKRPAMFVQSSGVGNMINALLSLTGFYELPLALFISHRGIYKEGIAAQVPMGKRLPGILKGAGIAYAAISTVDDIRTIEKKLPLVYDKNRIQAFLLSPAVFEEVCDSAAISPPSCPVRSSTVKDSAKELKPLMSRYDMIREIAPLLDGKVIVCNLGIPSKELYALKHQPSNFYMLGSMGMATPIGLGISLASNREVVVIDGDGSILMNPGTLATAAHLNPSNLTIIAVDNSSYGSTGGQPTLTGSCVDLAALAQGFGIGTVIRAAGKKQLRDALRERAPKLKFIHALALPGNAKVPNIPLDHMENKRQVMAFIRGAQGFD